MKQKISLVLSGGGARGIAHIGVIEELEKRGYEISSIAGTSMGSLVGGIYALGKMEVFKEWLYDLDITSIFGLIDFSFSSKGLIKGEKVLDAIKEFTSDADIKNLKIPYAAVAVDITHRKEVLFTEGNVFDAIRASISIPSVFTPVETENGQLIDGGILNNLPINHVKRSPNDILIAVNVNADIPPFELPEPKVESEEELSKFEKKLKEFSEQLKELNPLNDDDDNDLGYVELLTETIDLMTNHNIQMTLNKYPPDLLINTPRESCGIFDFFNAEEIVEIGRQAAIKSLDEYENKNDSYENERDGHGNEGDDSENEKDQSTSWFSQFMEMFK